MGEPRNSPETLAYKPHWFSRLAFQVVSLLFFATQILVAMAVARGWYWAAVPLMLIASHFMHGQIIGFHEASHGLLRKNRLVNDVEGVFIGALSFMSFTLYRVSHQTHHMYLSSARDEELWPFVRPDMPRWIRCGAAFLELNFGLFYSPFLFLRTFLRRNTTVRSKRIRRRIWGELAFCAGLWIVTLSAVAYFGVWKYFLWLYLLPAFIAGNLQSWRKYIEHVGITGNTVNSSTRSIVPETWLGRVFAFTLLHEPFHGVHHQRAGLEHAELPGYVEDLQPKTEGEMPPFQNYTQALWHLVRSLGDPKVGAQWLTREPNERANSNSSHPAATT